MPPGKFDANGLMPLETPILKVSRYGSVRTTQVTRVTNATLSP